MMNLINQHTSTFIYFIPNQCLSLGLLIVIENMRHHFSLPLQLNILEFCFRHWILQNFKECILRSQMAGKIIFFKDLGTLIARAGRATVFNGFIYLIAILVFFNQALLKVEFLCKPMLLYFQISIVLVIQVNFEGLFYQCWNVMLDLNHRLSLSAFPPLLLLS